MRRSFSLLLLLFCTAAVQAQPNTEPATPIPNQVSASMVRYNRTFDQSADVRDFFDERLRPFYHGVASGDPLADRVILWTRVTPESDGPVTVMWRIARDRELQQVVSSGTITTDQAHDYTVKVDADGLEPGTTYYYGFTALGRNSLTGRTRTVPAGDVDRLRFAVVSCSNYQQGYFNAYARIAERNDLDAIVHLGDYIYEYQAGGYGYTEGVDRVPEPTHEIVTLEDYRTRHSLYKLDPDLRRLHQQHPIIAVWDDHESANDAYREGAQNHDPDTEGPWSERKQGSIAAYEEWMPIRVSPTRSDSIFRSISYGTLVDLIMLDTRLFGRDEQIAPKGGSPGGGVDTADWQDPERTMLGEEQREWFLERLASSTAQWKIIGNQVMMLHGRGFTNFDAWDGYPAERDRILRLLRDNAISNVVVLTGDIHTSFAAELSLNPFDTTVYNPQTGKGALAVEFVGPSICSANLNELNNEPPRTGSPVFEAQIRLLNPHIRFAELDSHGYILLDVTDREVRGEWYFVDTLFVRSEREIFAEGWSVLDGTPRLRRARAPLPDRSGAPLPAPPHPPAGVSDVDGASESGILVIGNYPNPAHDMTSIHYVVARTGPVTVTLYDATGSQVEVLFSGTQTPSVYGLSLETEALSSGTYYYVITSGRETIRRKLVVQH